MESHPTKSEFACVKKTSRLRRSCPRSVVNGTVVRPTPTIVRPRPRVCERSARIGPADVDVFTGAPPSKRNVSPLLVAPIGTLATLCPAATVRKLMMEPFCETADGTKWSPGACTVAGLLGPAVPPSWSGLVPLPKMKRSATLSRRDCASADAAAVSVSARTSRRCVIGSRMLRRRPIGYRPAQHFAVATARAEVERDATVLWHYGRRPRGRRRTHETLASWASQIG